MRVPVIIATAALTVSLLGGAPATAQDEEPKPPRDAQITFLAELPHRGAALESAAQSVSTPGNRQFRNYRTLQQAAQQFGATDAQIANMRKVARERGLRAEVDPTRLVVRLTGSVETWEKLMGQPVQFTPSQPGNPYNTYAFFANAEEIPSINNPRFWEIFAKITNQTLAGVPAGLRGAITRIAPMYGQYVPADDVPDESQSAASAANVSADDATSATPSARALYFPGAENQTPPTNAAADLMRNCLRDPNLKIGLSNIFSSPVSLGSFVGHNQIDEVYGLTRLQRSHGKAASGRVAVFSLGGGFSEQDLSDAAECFGFNKPKVNIALGTGMPSRFVNVDDEATLDVQAVSAILKNADAIHVVQVPQVSGPGPFVDGYTRALALNPLPHAITNSYGDCEPSWANQGMFRTLESVFQFAAVMGVTSVVAAGDGGASTCQMLNYPNLDAEIEKREELEQLAATGQIPADQLSELPQALAEINAFVEVFTSAVAFPRPTVAYPGSSPYVLSVGGTSIDLNPDGTRRGEYVWNDLPYAGPGAVGNHVGTGGPSLSFDAPWYQQPLTRSDMRSIPDVSALAGVTPALPMFINGALSVSGGTSQASPIVAASLALVSTQEVTAGRPALGFANPWIYDIAKRHPKTIYDVTVGENQFPVPYSQNGTNIPACCQANLGYDQASGLGVLNFEAVARHTRVRGR